jgi:tetratricopeptide (TPR) repeat protein
MTPSSRRWLAAVAPGVERPPSVSDARSVDDLVRGLDGATEAEAAQLLAGLTEAVARRGLSAVDLQESVVPWLERGEAGPAAAALLGRAGLASAVEPLRVALARTACSAMRVEVLVALASLGRRSFVLRTVRSMLAHAKPPVRACAFEVLERVARNEDAETCAAMLHVARAEDRARLAALVYRLGDPRGFAPLARALRDLRPSTPPDRVERVLRAVAYAGTRRFLPAVEELAGRTEHPWVRVRANAVAAKLATSGYAEPSLAVLLETGEAAWHEGDLDGAARQLREILRLDPDGPEARRACYVLANALKESDRHAEALETIDLGVELDPSSWRNHRLRGSLLWDVGRHEQALASYDRALALRPTDPYTWYYKAYVLYRLRRDEEALPCLDRALTLRRDAPYLYNQKAFCLERLDRFADAVACYRRSLALKPDDPVIWDYLGQSLQSLGQLEEALDAFDRALSLAPHREDLLYHRADTLYDMQRWAESEVAFALALERAPDNFNAWFNRGLCLRFLERFEDATWCFEEALTLRPESARAREQRDACRDRK